MNHCLFKAKDTKGAVGNTVDYSSLTDQWRKNTIGTAGTAFSALSGAFLYPR